MVVFAAISNPIRPSPILQPLNLPTTGLDHLDHVFALVRGLRRERETRDSVRVGHNLRLTTSFRPRSLRCRLLGHCVFSGKWLEIVNRIQLTEKC